MDKISPVGFNNYYKMNNAMPAFTSNTNLLNNVWQNQYQYQNQQAAASTPPPQPKAHENKDLTTETKVLSLIALTAIAIWQRKNISKVYKQIFGSAESGVNKAATQTKPTATLPKSTANPTTELPKPTIEVPKTPAVSKVETANQVVQPTPAKPTVNQSPKPNITKKVPASKIDTPETSAISKLQTNEVSTYAERIKSAKTSKEYNTIFEELRYDINGCKNPSKMLKLLEDKATLAQKMGKERLLQATLEEQLIYLEKGSTKYLAVEKQAKQIETKLTKAAQEIFEKETKLAKDFFTKHEDEINKLFLDKDGKIRFFDSVSGKSVSATIDDLVKPYNEKLGLLCHGTNPESYKKIMTEGFNLNLRPKNGNDALGGVYFTLGNGAESYGKNIVKAKFNDKVCTANTDVLNGIRTDYKNRFAVGEILKKYNVSSDSAAEEIMRLFLNKQLTNRGYAGLLGNNVSGAAGCRYFCAMDPKAIEIIKPIV